MHVHSYYSGFCTVPFINRFCRESYNDPTEVHQLLKKRGMNLFTLSDHDSIESAEHVRHLPGFFLSEELTCRMPSGTEVHVGVYDFHERQHPQLQQRRNDLVSLLMYLTERRLFFSINHVFSSLTGRREAEDFEWFREYFPAVEIRNGHMLPSANSHAKKFAKEWGKIGVGGSDAHAIPSVGLTYTEVRGARTKEEFFEGLKSGHGRVRGESGSFSKLTRDVYMIVYELMREKYWTAALSPLALLVPVATLHNYVQEHRFAQRWGPSVLNKFESGKNTSWMSVPHPIAEESL